MALLRLTSDNPNFSHVLVKNPETQETSGEAFNKALPDGRVVLWFENPQEIYSYYSDFKNKSSNRKDILNFDQYTSGQYYLIMIESILRNAAFIPHELDIPGQTQLVFNLHNYHEFNYALAFPDFDIQVVTKNRNSHITIKAPTVREALQLCTIMCFDSIQTDPTVFINTSQHLKFAKYLSEYTKYYLILKRFLTSTESVKTQTAILEYFDKIPFNLIGKKAQIIRQEFIVSNTQSKKVLDLGCGTGSHFKTLYKKYETLVGVEINEEDAITAMHMTRKYAREDDSEIVTGSIQDYLKSLETLEDTDVICTEVLEHMPKDESVNVLNQIIDLKPKQIHITLPNHSFNQFYDSLFETGFRHDDHDWEPTFKEVEELFEPFKDRYTVLIKPLGDSLKDDPTCCTSIGIYLNRI